MDESRIDAAAQTDSDTEAQPSEVAQPVRSHASVEETVAERVRDAVGLQAWLKPPEEPDVALTPPGHILHRDVPTSSGLTVGHISQHESTIVDPEPATPPSSDGDEHVQAALMHKGAQLVHSLGEDDKDDDCEEAEVERPRPPFPDAACLPEGMLPPSAPQRVIQGKAPNVFHLAPSTRVSRMHK